MWMVLEHVDGWTLAEVLSRVGRLPQEAATAVALEVARALAHAHEKGISHRDVQPRNIVLSRRGEVKLVNFSVASTERLETAPELLDGGASYAGPSYMSPEQILGEPPDPRSDLVFARRRLVRDAGGRAPVQGAGRAQRGAAHPQRAAAAARTPRLGSTGGPRARGAALPGKDAERPLRQRRRVVRSARRPGARAVRAAHAASATQRAHPRRTGRRRDQEQGPGADPVGRTAVRPRIPRARPGRCWRSAR